MSYVTFTNIQKTDLKVHSILMIFIFVHWCKTWSVTLRANGVSVLEDRAVGLHEQKTEEVAGGRRKLCDGELK
jgi:hypothetical protein